jgi:hypothetical protein
MMIQQQSGKPAEHRFLSILAETLPPATMGFGWTEALLTLLRMTFSSAYLTVFESVTEKRVLTWREKNGKRLA